MAGNYNDEGYQPFLQQPGSQASYPAYPSYPPALPPAGPFYPPYTPYPPQAYGPGYPVYPYYAGPMAPATNGFAIASLILSISGFVILGLVGSILGVIFGHIAQGQIKRANPPEEGHGLATAGLIVGYIGIGLNVVLIGIWLIIFIIPLIALSASGGH